MTLTFNEKIIFHKKTSTKTIVSLIASSAYSSSYKNVLQNLVIILNTAILKNDSIKKAHEQQSLDILGNCEQSSYKQLFQPAHVIILRFHTFHLNQLH